MNAFLLLAAVLAASPAVDPLFWVEDARFGRGLIATGMQEIK